MEQNSPTARTYETQDGPNGTGTMAAFSGQNAYVVCSLSVDGISMSSLAGGVAGEAGPIGALRIGHRLNGRAGLYPISLSKRRKSIETAAWLKRCNVACERLASWSQKTSSNVHLLIVGFVRFVEGPRNATVDSSAGSQPFHRMVFQGRQRSSVMALAKGMDREYLLFEITRSCHRTTYSTPEQTVADIRSIAWLPKSLMGRERNAEETRQEEKAVV